MTVDVDFVRGADVLAPGLSRAEEPLLREMASEGPFRLRPLTFPRERGSELFAYSYSALPAALLLRRAPLVHIANSWYAHVVPMLQAPSIVTCHDLIELEEMEDGSRPMKAHRRFHVRASFRGMLAANIIACDSEATAARIRVRAPQVSGRLRVAYCGISPIFRPGPLDQGVLRRWGVEPPYVLYVGSEQPRKNLGRLVAAVQRVRRVLPNLSLVKVGGHQTPTGRAALDEALDREGMRDAAAVLEGVPDRDLLQLYRGAAVTALVSFREGFGYPPLEAMASGCPAIVSDRDSLPEVVGDAGLIADPLDIRSIAAAIERVTADESFRTQRVTAGLARAAGFTWHRTVNRYRSLYEEALGA